MFLSSYLLAKRRISIFPKTSNDFFKVNESCYLVYNGITYSLVLGQPGHTVLVGPLPLVGGVLGQSHINLGLELVS